MSADNESMSMALASGHLNLRNGKTSLCEQSGGKQEAGTLMPLLDIARLTFLFLTSVH